MLKKFHVLLINQLFVVSLHFDTARNLIPRTVIVREIRQKKVEDPVLCDSAQNPGGPPSYCQHFFMPKTIPAILFFTSILNEIDLANHYGGL